MRGVADVPRTWYSPLVGVDEAGVCAPVTVIRPRLAVGPAVRLATFADRPPAVTVARRDPPHVVFAHLVVAVCVGLVVLTPPVGMLAYTTRQLRDALTAVATQHVPGRVAVDVPPPARLIPAG